MPHPTTWTTESIEDLTATQIQHLLDHITNKRDRTIFLIAYRHGLRASEIGLLQVDDVDFTRHRINIHRVQNSLSGEHALQPDEAKAIKAYLRTRKHDSPFLFISKRRSPISRRMLDVLMKKYGTAIMLPEDRQHFHVLKHSIATHLLSVGADLSFVSAWLGHASSKSTMTYAQLMSKRRAQTSP